MDANSKVLGDMRSSLGKVGIMFSTSEQAQPQLLEPINRALSILRRNSELSEKYAGMMGGAVSRATILR